ncbi:MAG: hypothetical protein L6V93_19240 [Clostridiales bacterium]|nr:MAG: hypothetical protein L6V93_19240 [Clostridiales bacterium]
MLGHADYTVRCSVVNTFLDIADNEKYKRNCPKKLKKTPRKKEKKRCGDFYDR